MKNFLAVYRYRTRPRYRKGNWRQKVILIEAREEMDALIFAKQFGDSTYRKNWKVIKFHEVK